MKLRRMNYRRIINLYRKNQLDVLDNIALVFAQNNVIICFDSYFVFFNYSLKEEQIVKAKDDFELRAYKYFAKQVEANRDYLKSLANELQRNR